MIRGFFRLVGLLLLAGGFVGGAMARALPMARVPVVRVLVEAWKIWTLLSLTLLSFSSSAVADCDPNTKYALHDSKACRHKPISPLRRSK